MMINRTTRETPFGKIWISEYQSGDISIWSPRGSRAGTFVAETINGRAAWQPKFNAWFVPPVHQSALLADLCD